MAIHTVDTSDRTIDEADLATWLLFFLEAHGAAVVLHADRSVRVNLDSMTGVDAETVDRWAPAIVKLIPLFREILSARPTVLDGTIQ